MTYTLAKFEALSERQIAIKRHQLKCPFCHEEAYYRIAARSGTQSACFGSKYHLSTCEIVTRASSQDSGNDGRAANETPKRIKIKLRAVTPAGESRTTLEESQATSSKVSGAKSRISDTHDANSEFLPDTILKKLVLENLQHSSDIIEFHGLELPAHEFFVPLSEATPRDNSELRGYWGSIYNGAYATSGYMFLNINEVNDPRVMIPFELARTAELKFDVSHAHDLNGWYPFI